MFCPDCKAEYIEGITKCADCKVSLVWALPVKPEEKGEPIEWSPLVSSMNQADIALIKSILESENIPFWIQGELRGMVPHGLGLGPIVHVDVARLDDAKNLIKNLELNNLGFSTRKTGDID